METILSLKKICLTLGQEHILQDVSFSVGKGEVVSLIGKNGSGKSSVLKIIAGIYKASSGEIERKYTSLSYVPQKLQIDKSLPIKVEEYIQIQNGNNKQKQIQKYFELFECTNILGKQIGNLSGGELQKVLIISALIDSPDLILLDEATAGIDVVGEEIFYKNIAKTKKIFPNMSIILVSHNLHLVYKNSDKVICLHKDNYCCHGTPSMIKNEEKIKEIFGDYVVPYEHHPHQKHID